MSQHVYMMAGCQVGQSPSMLATYNCVSISIVDNTNKEKKKEITLSERK